MPESRTLSTAQLAVFAALIVPSGFRRTAEATRAQEDVLSIA